MSPGPLHWIRSHPWRFWLPNLVTAASITFGILSILASVEGHPISAAWYILWCTLADKLDGSVARFVHGNSNFGVQLDSFGDFLAFGIAPATLIYSSLAHAPGMGYESGWRHAFLLVAAVGYVLAVCFRLARFNITSMPAWAPRIFFGVPTTVVGGTVASLFLTLWKYGDSPVMSRAAFTDFHLFGGLSIPEGAMRAFPIYLVVGALLMVLTLRTPKLGKTPWPVANVAILALTILAYVVGPARIVPEYLLCYAFTVIVASLIYHLSAPHARKVAAPPLFQGGEAAERIVRSRLRATRRETRERRREERSQAKLAKQQKRKGEEVRKSS